MNERKNKATQPNEQKSCSSNSIQVGIDAFFKSSVTKAKDDVANGDISDDSDIALVAVVSPKRKIPNSAPASESPKKRKK